MKQPKKKSAKAILVKTGTKLPIGGRTPKITHRKLTVHQHHLNQIAARKAAHTRQINKLIKEGKLKPLPRKKRAAVMPENTGLPGWSWVLGCNDMYPTCAAAAVANHLYAFTGLRLAEHEVLELHKLAGGDEENGARIPDVLEYLYGCGGTFTAQGKVFKLARFIETDCNVVVTGLIVGLDFPHGSHSVLSHPDGMVSWGRVMPWRGEAEEAWAAEWMW